MRRFVLHASALLLLLLLSPAHAFALDFELVKGRKETRTFRATNNCPAVHVFALSKSAGAAWLRFTKGNRVTIAGRGEAPVEVEVDSAGLEAGTYSGQVLFDCLDCATDRGCAETGTVQVRLKVLWSPAELQSLDQTELIPNQLVLVLSAANLGAAKKAAREIERQHRLKRLEIFELKSVGRVVAVFEILNPLDSVAPLIERLQASPHVLSAQPNYLYETHAADDDPDPYAPLQRGLNQIGVDRARKHATGARVLLALLDSGVDYDHEDLKRVVTGKGNFTRRAGDFKRDIHGTNVAGIIAATPNNGKGILGVAPGVRILAIKVLKQTDPKTGKAGGTSATFARGLDFAILKSARIANMSFGGPRRKDSIVVELLDKADAGGMVMVAAAAGDKIRRRFPASYEKVIAVAAIDIFDGPYAHGDQGAYIDVAAPGVEVLCTWPKNRYMPSSGTSMAAAHVSGVVALLMEKKPGISAAAVRAILEETADDLGPAGRDEIFGRGRVDACRALEKIMRLRRMCE